MRKGEFDRTLEKMSKEVSHMLNGGATRETTIRLLMARIINANASFTSKQLRSLFELVL